jgi:hypothetical protein
MSSNLSVAKNEVVTITPPNKKCNCPLENATKTKLQKN